MIAIHRLFLEQIGLDLLVKWCLMQKLGLSSPSKGGGAGCRARFAGVICMSTDLKLLGA